MLISAIKTRLTEISLTDNGILIVDFSDSNADFDYEEAKYQLEAVNELTEGQKVPVLIDTTKSFQTPSLEARELLASYSFKKAEALVVKYLHQRITATFFIKLVQTKHNHPINIFTNKEKAMKWLEQFC
jgi:lipopolysaccharide export LptBFGC system permease protein LptF